MRNIINLLLLVVLTFTITACSGEAIASTEVSPTEIVVSGEVVESASDSTQTDTALDSAPISIEYENDDLDTSVNAAKINYIQLAGDQVTFEGSGVTVNGDIVTITSAGTYSISGTLNDGQINVDSAEKETVVLVFNGVDITYSTNAPIYISNAGKTVISLADGTKNVVTDGEAYTYEEAGSDEPNAAIFSKDDLTINGNGSLIVNANYNNGITSKDDLKITGGNITVNAVNDGIKGKDSIAVKDGIITINAGGDGMQSYNDQEPENGFIFIEGGSLSIIAGMDGIQAATRLQVSGGDITISSGGGSVNSSNLDNWGEWGMENNLTESDTSDTPSAKGLKAGVDITIDGGTITVDSSDDSIHSNNSLTINNGDMLLASGDDGIHSDATLEINGGDLKVTKSYEGIESAALSINDGNIYVVSSDDGINAAGGNDGSSIDGRPGQNEFNFSADYNLTINGGYIVIDSGGDGLDINGTIEMSAGVVLINGPTANNNGALDYLGSFDMSGGLLVAVGSAGMAQAPSASSTQYSVLYNFSSPLAAGTLIHIESEDGEEMLTFEPTKEYQSVVLSSPALTNGSTYLVYTAGSSTGMPNDGLYSGGTYTPGTQVDSFTVSSLVTMAGISRGGAPGGPGGDMRPPRP